MKNRLAVAAFSAAALCHPALAQDAPPPIPKPGPEHELLKGDVGTWDATVEMFTAPGAPPAVSKGVETNRLLGGLWLVSEFKSEIFGQPFEGTGSLGYDRGKSKYVGTWVDSMSSGYSTVEASYDAGTKTLTGAMTGPDMSGKVTTVKETTEWKDADTRVFTIWNKAPDGKETPGLRISYKRRK